MLRCWCDGPNLRLARRAWIVLEEADGKLEVELAAAIGLPSRVVQRLVRAFRHDGLLALLDAPRGGRPRISSGVTSDDPAAAESPSARDLAVQLGTSRDAIWRQARLEGRQPLERSRGTTLFEGRRLPNIAGIFMAGTATVIAIAGRNMQPGVVPSHGIHRSCGTSTQKRLNPNGIVDWRAEIEQCRPASTPAPKRALNEARVWFLDRAAAAPTARERTTFLLGGDATSQWFISWLAALKSVMAGGVDHGAMRQATLGCASNLPDWESLLLEHGVVDRDLARLTWPAGNAKPFVWSRTPPGLSKPSIGS